MALTAGSARLSASELQKFAERAQDWLDNAVPLRWREERGALSENESFNIRREWDRLLWQGGFSGLAFPTEYGGKGLSLAEDVLFHVLAASAQAPDGFSRVGKTLVTPMLLRSGTEQQRQRYIPPLLQGEELWCQGFSEPDAGSDLASVSTRATTVGGGYRLYGRKTWTTFGQYADRIFVLAVTDPEAPRYKNLSMFLVDMRAQGVSVDGIRQISGAEHFAETLLDGVFVPDEDRVGAEGEGWRIAMELLADERGGSETAARYVEIRADVDALIQREAGNLERQRELEDLDSRTEVLRWQLAKVVDLEEQGGDEFLRAACVLKVMWSELWQAATRSGLDTRTPSLRDHWRYQYLEARAVSIYSGTNEIQRNIIAERVLGLPR